MMCHRMRQIRPVLSAYILERQLRGPDLLIPYEFKFVDAGVVLTSMRGKGVVVPPLGQPQSHSLSFCF